MADSPDTIRDAADDTKRKQMKRRAVDNALALLKVEAPEYLAEEYRPKEKKKPT